MTVRKTDKERLEELNQKMEQMKAKKMQLETRLKEKERKERTKRLIEVGAIFEKYFAITGKDQAEKVALGMKEIVEKNKEKLLNIDEEKFKLWVSRGSQDSGCKSCFFAPSCHGDSCPLIRIQTSQRPCPQTKTDIKEVIKAMDNQGHTFIEITAKKKGSTIC